MDRSKSLRITLIILIIAGVMTIVWSFLSRRQEAVVVSKAEILSPEISRRSTKFEYTEHTRGRTVFKVYAETSIETVSKVHTLKDVNLAYYDETGKPSDVISGREAVYRIDEKQIEFSGDARIQLANGTEVFSDRVSADLNREIVMIDENFRFQRGEITGSGRGLIYLIPQREIRIEKGLQLVLPSGPHDVKARAPRALYRVSEQVIELIGNAAISGPDTGLTADQIALFLTEEHRIQKILSSGHAGLRSGSVKSFSGQAINVFFEPDSERMKYFEVLGGAPEMTSKRAVYRERVEGRVALLEADRITAVPRQDRRTERLLLKRFTAQGEVLFSSPALGIEEAHSDEMEGAFFESGEHLEQLDLRGQVSVRRKRKGSKAPVEEELHSDMLSLRLHKDGVLEHARAGGNVDLKVNFPEGNRHLFAREFVEVEYSGGLPERVVSRGDCRMESILPGERNVLKAPLIHIRYRQRLLHGILAEGGVTLESVEQGKTRYTTSERLKVSYQAGKIDKAVQSGNFRLREGDPATIETIDLRSDQAVFDPEIQRITMTGERSPVLRLGDANSNSGVAVETITLRFELDRKTGEMFAFGRVRSSVREEDGSIIITSGRMQSDPETGWVSYFVNPRIIQQSNSIAGKIVRYNHRDHELVVEGEVESSFMQGSETHWKRYWVEANHLVYKRSQLRARYEGQVRIETEDLVVNAPFVEFVFEPTNPNQIQEIIAWGGVQITEENREAKGNRAVHYPSEEKVVLTGDPAQVVEIKRGKAVGRQLTFYIGEERLLVENPSAPQEP
ncbi:LPS export ABC transporter periplasmic protein LptC [Acidobacteria bacterium AH-259-L09]|nr:LPS export ABC transporter periplasmic protein LptC [Acidobacteria bacterium AH-259-L09]